MIIMNRLDKKQIFIGTILGIILSILTLILLTRNIQPLSAQQTTQKYTVFKSQNLGFKFVNLSGQYLPIFAQTPTTGSSVNQVVTKEYVDLRTYWQASGNNIYNINTGNVGIGTTTPQKKLDVVGGYIRSDKGFCIGNNCIENWPVSGGGVTIYQGTGIILSPNPITQNGNISVDTNYVQRRVTGKCSPNQAIIEIKSDGTVTCVDLPPSAICTWGSKTYSTGAVCYDPVGPSCFCGGWNMNGVMANKYVCSSNGSWIGPASECLCSLLYTRCGN